MYHQKVTSEDISNIKNTLNQFLESYGFESHCFKLDWYNCKVHKLFRLPYNDDSVAFTIISTPSMFEKAFLPYLFSVDLNNFQDPLDQCMKNCFGKIQNLFPDFDIELIHDFELTPSRKPKILMQTAGHVSGAAKFYQRSCIDPQKDPWDKNKKIFGVSLHPKYGGWFAFRAVVILKNVICKELKQQEPKTILADSDVINLLTLFNDCWKDSRYRDVVPVQEKYSELQIQYFTTSPMERHQLIHQLQNCNRHAQHI